MTQARKRMLIVDDNDLTRALLRGLLRNEEEYEVVGEASNGEMAVELTQRLKPDIVCLDVDMPKMGGLEALARIREISPQTVVLMVTAHTERETVQTAIAHGAAGYIVKPFNAGRVLSAIEAAMAKVVQK
ncbi:MAG: response regulator transcription factor [Rhodocyclales bacterium]|nr:response regulator transcription factor [Rhodocyclales bacterium]